MISIINSVSEITHVAAVQDNAVDLHMEYVKG